MQPNLSFRGKAPRTMKKKRGDNDEVACGVETVALTVYLFCGAIGVGLIIRQVGHFMSNFYDDDGLT